MVEFVLIILQVYYGPTSTAREYFCSLGFKNKPRQSTADFLTGCTDPNERQVADGVDPATVPSTPQALEAAFRESSLFQTLVQERSNYKQLMQTEKHDQEEFRRTVEEAKRKGVAHNSPYTATFWQQVWAIVVRQTLLTWQDKFGLYSSYVITIVCEPFNFLNPRLIKTSKATGIILGSTFYDLPLTSAGAFTR